jgi:hypothetical protein
VHLVLLCFDQKHFEGCVYCNRQENQMRCIPGRQCCYEQKIKINYPCPVGIYRIESRQQLGGNDDFIYKGSGGGELLKLNQMKIVSSELSLYCRLPYYPWVEIAYSRANMGLGDCL